MNHGGMMRKIALFVLFFSAFRWPAQGLDDYPVVVHVSSSHWVIEPSISGFGPQAVQKLNVVINGRKYELETPTKEANFQAGVTLLAPGDYKAALIRDVHTTAYESSQAYLLLFPDKKTTRFIVVGLSE
jgi:hypothetical protein